MHDKFMYEVTGRFLPSTPPPHPATLSLVTAVNVSCISFQKYSVLL